MAAEVKAWLEGEGHGSVFLDFDPEVGIPAGRSWEQELYRQLRACRAVILVCSEHSMSSRWCFAEITHARSLGKPIFPLKVDGCEVDPVLTDRQIIDLTSDRERAFERLARGLALAGIDAANPFDWDGSRPPYPGLLCFQEKDAAIFFGRDKEVGRGLDLLHQVRRYGGAGLLLVLGGSGSGKSSLVRAGMIPRLRRDRDNWLVVDPFRPGEEPWETLAAALATAFERAGEAGDRKDIRRRLEAGPGPEADGGEPLVELARDLRQAAGQTEATVLLVVDQFEELLAHPDGHPSADFLARLREALEDPRAPLLAVATLRSDFLGSFQKNRAIGGIPFRDFLVGGMSVEALTEVIVKPAELAGLDMEQALVQALLEDTRTEDALPLLAFTLRELYELATADSTSLGVSEYRDRLGGLQGSVARAAEGLLEVRPLTGEQEEELRGAFLGMVRMDEDGHFARDALSWNLLSESAHEWLERFVQARLLVKRGDGEESTVEVAHEALFRAWEKLAGWLDENREALILRRELGQAARLWERGGRDSSDLWRGGRLRRALEVRDETYDRRREAREEGKARGLRLPMAPEELEFLEASDEAEQRQERRRKRIRAAVLAASIAIAAVMTVLSFLASRARDQAREARDRAETRALATQARIQRQGKLDLSLLLSLEVGRRGDRFESGRLLYEGLVAGGVPRLETLLRGHADPVRAVAWSPDGRLLATGAGAEPAVLLWDVAAERPEGRPLAGADAGVWGLAWSPDGQRLAAAAADGAALLWDFAGAPAEPRRLADPDRPAEGIVAVAFSPDGATLAAARSDHLVRLWDVEMGRAVGPLLAGATDRLQTVVWSPDGAVVAAAGMDKKVRLWSAAVTATGSFGEPLGPPLEGHLEGVTSLAWRPDGRYLASGGRDGEVVFWDRAPEARHRRVQPAVGDVASLAWDSAGETLVYAGTDGRLQLTSWELREGMPGGTAGSVSGVLRAPLLDVGWSPDGRRLASGHGSAVAIWSARRGPRLGRFADLGWSEVHRAVPSPDGALLAAVGRDPKTRVALGLWDLEDFGSAGEMKGSVDRGSRLAWSADGRTLQAVDRERTVRRWELSTGLILAEWPAAAAEDAGRIDLAEWGAVGARLAIAAGDGSMELWDAEGERLLASTPVPEEKARTTSLAWTRDGKLLAAGDRDGRLRAWDGATGSPRFDHAEAHADQLLSLAWSPDGTVLASGGRDGKARLWDATTGEPVGRPLDHGGAGSGGSGGSDVTRLAWSPDGSSLATATRDRRVRLWDVARGESYAQVGVRQEYEVSALFFSPDGASLTSIAVDGSAQRWNVDLAAWHELACRIANRNLTPEEWSEHLPEGEPYRETCPTIAAAGTRGAAR